MRSFKPRGLFFQYFWSYFIVMLTVATILLGYAYFQFSRFHAQNVINNHLSNLTMIREANETELSRIAALAAQFTSNPDVTPFVFANEPEKAIRIINQLAVYRASNGFFSSVNLSFYDDEYVFSPTSSYLLNNFVERAALFENITAQELLDMLRTIHKLTVYPIQVVKGYLYTTQKDKYVIPIFAPVTYTNGVHCGTALFLVDYQSYLQMFRLEPTISVDVFVLNDQQVLVSRQTTNIMNEELFQYADTAVNTVSSVTFDNRDYVLINLDGKSLSYRYVMLIPKETLLTGLGANISGLILFAGMASILGVLLIIIFVHSRIKPIRVLKAMLTDTQTNGNELIQIRDRVQYLIDNNEELLLKMESFEILRKADFALKFLRNDFDNEDDYLAWAEEIKVNVDLGYYIVCILGKPNDSDYDLSLEKLDLLFNDSYSGMARTLDLYGRVSMIVFASDTRRLAGWLQDRFLSMRSNCSGLAISFSAFHSDFKEGPRAYLEAENAYEKRFILGNEKAIQFVSAHNDKSTSSANHQQSMERLRLALVADDAERVSVSLTEISRIMRKMNTTLFSFRCMYNDILYIITVEARKKGLEAQQVYDLFSLSQCLSLNDLDIMLHNACSLLINTPRAETASHEVSHDMAQAIRIIQKQFSSPSFSITAIAQELGMSDSKFSVEFKQAYHLTPLQFLTMQRMRLARRLLRQTNMPIKDIAIECGYYEITGFNRRFKAYTSMTPQQYRKNSEEMEENFE